MNPFQTNSNIIYANSTKEDGNMSFRYGEKETTIENRKKFLAKYGVDIKDCIIIMTEDGERITVVDSTNKASVDSFIPTEALITKDRNLTLFLMTGDCLPIALYDPNREVIALAHLGWKPTNNKLITKVVERMKNEFGSNPQDILACIGSGIHKESYVFPDPIQKTLPDWQPFLKNLPSGDTQIDIVGYNRAQMLSVGLKDENIFIDPTDTAISENYF